MNAMAIEAQLPPQVGATGVAAAADPDHLLHLYREMVRIRDFEEKCVELYASTKIRGFLHVCIGEEAVAVGAMQALRPDDQIVATYREHGQALARGVSTRACMAEMYGKQEGCSRGRGGSMHLFDRQTNFCGGNAIVGGGLPLAVGLALAQRMQRQPHITACFFGDGATAEGVFHESMNLAALWQLPVLFLLENNFYSMGLAIERAQSQTNLTARALSYRMPAETVDGMDVLACEEAALRAADYVRSGAGPYFLNFHTYRFRAHSMYDPELYRSKDEVELWRRRDPIATFRERLAARPDVTRESLERIEQEAAAEIADAIEFAEQGTLEPVEDLERFVTSEVTP
jgi:pyruvate dehydrogenase E1 component alpha subunit